jgi:peptide/nickel transport system substrate-binding protein
MKKKIYLIILVLMIFIPTLTFPMKIPQPEARSESNEIVPKASSSSIPLIYGTTRDIYTLDPVDCWDPYTPKVLDQVVETLFTYNYSDPDLPLIPLLATGVSDISAGGLNYTIDLRDNATFHDGTEFNATAAKWNFDRMEYWWNFSGALPSMESIGTPYEIFHFEDGETPIWNRTEIVSDYSIKFVLNAPFIPFLDILTYTAAAIVSPTSHGWDITSPISPVQLPIGTGPFVMDSHIYNNKTEFHAFENYWRETANISELIFYYYDNSMALANYLLEGRVHFIDQIYQNSLPTLVADPDITVIDEGKPDSTIRYFVFNNNIVNQTMRQALSYAINYSYLIKELWADAVVRLKSPVPEGIRYSNYGSYPNFNITLARMIMQSLGFGVGLNATYPGPDDVAWQSASFASYKFWVYAPSSTYNIMYSLCRDWFDLIGITLNAEYTEWDYFLNQWTIDPDWIDMWLFGWMYDYNDPSNAINYLFSNATSELYWAMYGQVNDSYLQNLMDQGLTETNPVVREATYYEIQRYLLEDLMPYAWLYNNKLYHAHHVALTGFTQNIFNRYRFYDYNWEPPFTFDIEILSSGDISFIKGTTGNIINWTMSSDALINTTYNIYVNNILNTTGSWDIDVPVIINLDDLAAGIYEYKIEVFNYNKTAENIVNVNVQPHIFDITHPSDITYDEGDTGNAILWTVTSNLIANPNYSIYVDDVLNRTGFWDTGEPIAISVDGLPVGTYEYRIEVNNFNTTIQDIVMVTVETPTKPEPEIPGYSVVFLIGFSIIAILYIHRKLKKKLS